MKLTTAQFCFLFPVGYVMAVVALVLPTIALTNCIEQYFDSVRTAGAVAALSVVFGIGVVGFLVTTIVHAWRRRR